MSFKDLILVACFIALTTASPVDYYNQFYVDEEYQPTLIREVRSPDGGSLDISYNQDQGGRAAAVQYNQNLFRSDDGRLTVDAYARGSRNFDFNRNNYDGGIIGSYRF